MWQGLSLPQSSASVYGVGRRRSNTLAGESLTRCVTLAKSQHPFRSQLTYLLKRKLDFIRALRLKTVGEGDMIWAVVEPEILAIVNY